MGTDQDTRRRQIAQGVQIAGQPDVPTSASKALNDRDERRHSREDALDPREFEYLVRATHKMKPAQELEGRTALYATGKLGLRGGEVAHLHEDWINWTERRIEIPEHDSCRKGKRSGEVCGYCRRRALEEMETNNISQEEAIAAIRAEYSDEVLTQLDAEAIQQAAHDLRDEVNITEEEALSRRWKPKTPQSARHVPFDFDVRVQMTIEDFFDEYDSWEKSKSTLNRRINRIAELCEEDIEIYPHALRATAASTHAAREVSAYSLMSIMGWSDIGTARSYINSNSTQAAREIRSKHR